MIEQAPVAFVFGAYRLDPAERTLTRAGRLVPLTPKAFDTLVALVERSGRIVTKDELLGRVWPETAVEEGTLTQNVFILRKALGDTSDTPTFIETVTKIGYRFVAPVQRGAPAGTAPVLPVGSPRGWWLAVVVLSGLVAGLYLLLFATAHPVSAGKIMMAVMPFENLSGDPAQEYLSDGLTEEMITKLSQLGAYRLGIIARTTAMTYRHTSKTVADVGRELGVNYVLEGSVRRAGDRVRITAQLIGVRDQAHVWSESYDRDMREILAVESGVASAIAREVDVSLAPDARDRLAHPHPVDPEANELYLRGLYQWNMRTHEHTLQAREYFQRAIDRDPTDVRSYAALAETYAGFDWVEQQRIAAPLVARALTLDDRLADAHTANAILKESAYDWPGAEREFRRAIELDPSSAPARFFHAECLQAVELSSGNAIAEVQRALVLDPFSVLTNQAYGSTLFYGREYEQAADALRRTLELNPDYLWAHLRLMRIYAQQGRLPEAESEFRKARAGDPSLDDSWLAVIDALAGRRREALARLARLGKRGNSLFAQALAYTSLGDGSTALDLLERVVVTHDVNVKYLAVDPLLFALHGDPRFDQLLRRTHLR